LHKSDQFWQLHKKMSRFEQNSPIKQQENGKNEDKVDDRGRFSLELGDLRETVGAHAHRIDRSMNYIICGIIAQYYRVNQPGFKEPKKYRID
jgi:hypothetical protein